MVVFAVTYSYPGEVGYIIASLHSDRGEAELARDAREVFLKSIQVPVANCKVQTLVVQKGE